MNSRERVIKTIERINVDRAPYSFDLTSRIALKLSEHYKIDPQKLHEYIKDDLLYVSMHNQAENTDSQDNNNTIRDEFGVLWNASDKSHDIGDWGDIVYYPLQEPTLAGYKYPNGSAPGRFDHLDLTELKCQNRFVILGITGLFDLCWHLRSFEGFMMDMASDETFACELLDKALEFNLGVISQIPDAIDGVRFGEDWGLQKGLITGAPLWRKLLKPRLKIMYEAANKKGLMVFIHSCGDIQELFEDIIELKVDVVHPIQPEAMNVALLHQKYGDRISMYGGIGTQSTIVYGKPSDVITEARSRLEIFKGGGYILGPAGAISTDAKIENVIALVDFVMNNYQ